MKTVMDWLGDSPLPVIGRIIDCCVDARHIAISASLYDKDTIVVLSIETLKQLIYPKTSYNEEERQTND